MRTQSCNIRTGMALLLAMGNVWENNMHRAVELDQSWYADILDCLIYCCRDGQHLLYDRESCSIPSSGRLSSVFKSMTSNDWWQLEVRDEPLCEAFEVGLACLSSPFDDDGLDSISVILLSLHSLPHVWCSGRL